MPVLVGSSEGLGRIWWATAEPDGLRLEWIARMCAFAAQNGHQTGQRVSHEEQEAEPKVLPDINVLVQAQAFQLGATDADDDLAQRDGCERQTCGPTTCWRRPLVQANLDGQARAPGAATRKNDCYSEDCANDGAGQSPDHAEQGCQTEQSALHAA